MVDLRIREIRAPTDGEWEAAWRSSRFATYFQSPFWLEAWRSQANGRFVDSTFVATFTDGVTAVIPVGVERRLHGMVDIAHMSPAGTWGGPLMTEGGARHRRVLTSLVLSRFPNLNWLDNPFGSDATRGFVDATRRDATLVVDLAADMDSIVRRWSKGHRSAVSQARRLGVTTHVASTEAEWKDYFRAYEDSLRRWGKHASSSYPWQLFDALRRQPSSVVRLWLAKHEGSVVSGALCFYSNDVVSFWHGATSASAFQLRPAHLLLFEAIGDAVAQGHAIFDLGPSGGHDGVEHFKRGFAPRKVVCDVFITRSRPVALARSIASVARRGGRRG